MGEDFADEAVRGREGKGRGYRRGHGMAEGDVPSANKTARTPAVDCIAVLRGGGGASKVRLTGTSKATSITSRAIAF